MTLQQLIERFRNDADDRIAPFLWSDEWLAAWFTEAQDEAAVRARLLLDDYSPAVTEIAVSAGVDSYPLHPKLYEIARLDFIPAAGRATEPYLTTREKLDRDRPEWRSMPPADPVWAIQTDTRLRLAPVPVQDGLLRLEAYRLPLKPLVNDGDKPEIHEAHHIHLCKWVMHRAFGRPDADTFDAGRSQQGRDDFDAYFGRRPDADLRRSTRHDETQANVAYIL
ncbi:phage adaptor protein [Acidovorax sp. BL-A-41-H1]|uniref:phage adaptor protein n=1 Tax=Acidovorax sp. BL-A-41-H1 TaxID=3421102 RepID=UPI003F7B27EA